MTTAGTPTKSFRPDIQGLRAIAILLVVAFHADLPVPGGFVGVDVFFVISGFVITSLLMRQARKDRLGSILPRFYARRIRRLLPALSLVVFVTLLASLLFQPLNGAQQETIKTAIGTMFLAANVVIERSFTNYFFDNVDENPLLNMWSLSVEEQFYLVFPLTVLLALWLGRRFLRRSWLPILVTAAIGTISFLLSLAASFGYNLPLMASSPQVFAFYSASTRAWEFAAGALLAMLSVRRTIFPRVGPVLPGIVGVIVLAVAAFAINESQPFPGLVGLIPVLGTVLLIEAGSRGDSIVQKLLSSSTMNWLGDRSYSWYLWHWPLMVFAALLLDSSPWLLTLCAVVSLGMADVTYRCVEQPIRRGTNLTLPRMASITAAWMAPTLALAIIMGVGVSRGWGQQWALGSHVAISRGCDSPPIEPEKCSWGVEGARGDVFVVGDSQGWAAADGVIAAASEMGLRTVVSTHNNCPFVVGQADLVENDTCNTWRQSVYDYVVAYKPDVVVVANSRGYGPELRDVTPAVRSLSNLGSGVIIIQQPPPGDEQGGRKSLISLDAGGDRFTSKPDLPSEFRTELALADSLDGVAVVDPWTILCTDALCRTTLDGEELYTDGSHLSVRGSQLLTPSFIRAMSEVLNES